LRARAHATGPGAREARLGAIAGARAGLPGGRASLLPEDREPRPYPTLVIHLDESNFGRGAAALVNELIDGDPPIAVSQNFLHEGALTIVASVLQPGEEATIADRLRELLGRAGG